MFKQAASIFQSRPRMMNKRSIALYFALYSAVLSQIVACSAAFHSLPNTESSLNQEAVQEAPPEITQDEAGETVTNATSPAREELQTEANQSDQRVATQQDLKPDDTPAVEELQTAANQSDQRVATRGAVKPDDKIDKDVALIEAGDPGSLDDSDEVIISSEHHVITCRSDGVRLCVNPATPDSYFDKERGFASELLISLNLISKNEANQEESVNFSLKFNLDGKLSSLDSQKLKTLSKIQSSVEISISKAEIIFGESSTKEFPAFFRIQSSTGSTISEKLSFPFNDRKSTTGPLVITLRAEAIWPHSTSKILAHENKPTPGLIIDIQEFKVSENP